VRIESIGESDKERDRLREDEEYEESEATGEFRWYGTGLFRALVILRRSKKLGDPLRRGIEGLRLRELELLFESSDDDASDSELLCEDLLSFERDREFLEYLAVCVSSGVFDREESFGLTLTA